MSTRRKLEDRRNREINKASKGGWINTMFFDKINAYYDVLQGMLIFRETETNRKKQNMEILSQGIWDLNKIFHPEIHKQYGLPN